MKINPSLNGIVFLNLFMKSLLVLFVYIFSSLLLFSQEKKFKLSGKIKGMNNGYMYLNYVNAEGNTIDDSCLVTRGKFIFKGQISEPVKAYLSAFEKPFANSGENKIEFYLDEASIRVRGKIDYFNKSKIIGSKTQDESEQLIKAVDLIDEENERYAELLMNIQKGFLETYPHSFVSANILSNARYSWSTDTLEKYFNKLNADVKNGFYGNRVSKFLKDISENSIGRTAKEFNAVNFDGKEVKLSDYKGKYVLLNFWASWCVPCRESTPHLIELFKKYRQNNFAVIAISVDEDRKAWTSAIEKDEMRIWNNIMARQGNEGAMKIDENYFIFSVPTLMLINKEGVIIGRYTGTQEEQLLEKKLIEIFIKNQSNLD